MKKIKEILKTENGQLVFCTCVMSIAFVIFYYLYIITGE